MMIINTYTPREEAIWITASLKQSTHIAILQRYFTTSLAKQEMEIGKLASATPTPC